MEVFDIFGYVLSYFGLDFCSVNREGIQPASEFQNLDETIRVHPLLGDYFVLSAVGPPPYIIARLNTAHATCQPRLQVDRVTDSRRPIRYVALMFQHRSGRRSARCANSLILECNRHFIVAIEDPNGVANTAVHACATTMLEKLSETDAPCAIFLDHAFEQEAYAALSMVFKR